MSNQKRSLWILAALSVLTMGQPAFGLPHSALIQSARQDRLGPFTGIRWFCPDGTTRSQKNPCPKGVQHGVLKKEFGTLEKTDHLFLAPILAQTKFDAFWNADRQHSRAIQYLITRFLVGVDGGWIEQKSQYARGLRQIEDESEWAGKFLRFAASSDARVGSQYFLMRQLVRGLPEVGRSDALTQIRNLSEEIANRSPAFGPIRARIHSGASAGDVARVREFSQSATLTPASRAKLDQLASVMTTYFNLDFGHLPRTHAGILARMTEIGALMRDLRHEALSGGPADRVRRLQLSLLLEDEALRLASIGVPVTAAEAIPWGRALVEIALGAGFISEWEFAQINNELNLKVEGNAVAGPAWDRWVSRLSDVTVWGSQMVVATFEDEQNRYASFEPLVRTYSDDVVRRSVLLPLGRLVAALSVGREEGGKSGIRGMTPGVAYGPLVVSTSDEKEVDPKSILAISGSPSLVSPVAGIITTEAGNPVAHIQLLARNLGIPSAVVLPEKWATVERFSGQSVFLAVSSKGKVVFKPNSQLTTAEWDLVKARVQESKFITIPTDRMATGDLRIRSLFDLLADDSGVTTGPKAANLGQLSHFFPEMVPPGVVVPFGRFYQQMNQKMPGQASSYWQFVQDTETLATRLKTEGKPPAIIESQILSRYQVLRSAIEKMAFTREFEIALASAFSATVGKWGDTLAFVRSDTNMEDLKDFTGAGLNLTVPNVRSRAEIERSIRQVWASVYSDRSYQWRQKYVTNASQIMSSVLIQKTVPSEKSGVVLTTRLDGGPVDGATMSFNQGVSGAVDSQRAETWVAHVDGRMRLVAPARERTAKRTLPQGGVTDGLVLLNHPVLSDAERAQLWVMIQNVRAKGPILSQVGISAPYDMEMAFAGGKLWLLQLRPISQSKRVRKIQYLTDLDAHSGPSWSVSVTEKIRW